MDGESVPEGGCRSREGPVPPGPALGPDGLQGVCTGGPKATGWGVKGEEV